MAYGVTASGFSRPQLSDIKTEIEDSLKTVFGADIDLGADGPFGQLVGIFAEREDLVWQAMEDTYNSQYPDTSFGNSLDNVGAISGIPRQGALASRVLAQRLFGDVGTVVPITTQIAVQDAPTSVFKPDAEITLVAGSDAQQKIQFSGTPNAGSFKIDLLGQETPAIAYNATAATVQGLIRALFAGAGDFFAGVVVSGSISATGLTFDFSGVSGKQSWPAMTVSSNVLTLASVPVTSTVTVLQPGVVQGEVDMTASSTGPIVAPAGTLNEILTPVVGLNSTWNISDAVVGRNKEADNAYRARRGETLQVAGAATPDAIRSRLLSLSGVTAVIVFENDTDIADLDGRPPHSFEAVVEGGVVQEIIDLLWAVKPAGILTYGSTTGTALDSQGQSHDVSFSRPTSLPIYVELDLTIDSEFPSNGVALVKQAIVDSGNALGIGKDVVVIPKLIASIADIPGIVDAEIRVGVAPSPTLSDNIAVDPNEIASFDTTRVAVTTA